MKKSDLKLFGFLVFCIVLLGLASALKNITVIPLYFFPNKTPVETPVAVPKLTYIPQFVLISFDGSRSVDIWKKLREFKDEMKREGKRLNYTHFINAAYFLTHDTKHFYKGPEHEAGTSNIGFSEDLNHLRQRIEEANLAIADGDEIAVHTVGHFSGLTWSKENWMDELTSFDGVMFNLEKLYPNAGLPKLNLTKADVIGFRAPYLDHGPGLYDGLHALPGYRYDSTEVAARQEIWPTKDAQGLWHIPLASMHRGSQGVLVMDYNWYAQDTQAVDGLQKGTQEWQAVYDKTLAGLRAYFSHNYEGNRAPVLVGYHFENWNDGVYWELLKTFAAEVCGKPQVRCGTFKELVAYLDEYGAPADAKADMAAAAYDAAMLELVENEHNE